MENYLAFAQDLARQAGKLIKDNFGSDPQVKLKPDNSPVTKVDVAINNLVIKAVSKTYPDHGVFGEETNHGTGKEELQWLCDPLDGTKAYILGVPLSTFILGLTKRGTILSSVVYNPFTDQMYHAVKGGGAFCNDQPIHVSDASLSDGGIVILSESSFQYDQAIIEAGAQIEPLPGAGYRSTLLASGRCSGILQAHADFHDVGPASLLVEEAGGKVTAFDGSAISYDARITEGIILSNGVAHEALLKITSA